MKSTSREYSRRKVKKAKSYKEYLLDEKLRKSQKG